MINIKVRKNPPEYAHDVVYVDEVRIGIVGKSDNKIYLEKCPMCRLENYAPAVASGVCAWCGWDVKPEWEQHMRGMGIT